MLKAVLLLNKYQIVSNELMMEHAKAFERCGLQIDVFENVEELGTLSKYLVERPLFFFSCDGVGVDITYSGKSLYTFLKVPLVTVMFDTMDCAATTQIDTVDNSYIHYILYDTADADYIKKYLPSITHYSKDKPCGFLADGEYVPIADRPQDISFCGNILSETMLRDRFNGEAMNGIECTKLFDEICDYLMPTDDISMCEGVEHVLTSHGIELSGKVDMNFHRFVRRCMLAVRSHRRRIILRALAVNGFKVNIYGMEDRFEGLEHENLIYCGVLMFNGDLLNMTRSKIILNTNSLTKAAMNRRQLCAMLNGAVVLTDTNAEIDKHFKDGEDIAVFSNAKLEEIPDIVGKLLENPNKMQKISQNAISKTKEAFSFMHRTQDILDIAVSMQSL